MSDTKETKKLIILPEHVEVNYEFEKMLKTFMKDIDKRGILKEVKARRYYNKPSEIKHKLFGAIARKKKLERKQRRKK